MRPEHDGCASRGLGPSVQRGGTGGYSVLAGFNSMHPAQYFPLSIIRAGRRHCVFGDT